MAKEPTQSSTSETPTPSPEDATPDPEAFDGSPELGEEGISLLLDEDDADDLDLDEEAEVEASPPEGREDEELPAEETPAEEPAPAEAAPTGETPPAETPAPTPGETLPAETPTPAPEQTPPAETPPEPEPVVEPAQPVLTPEQQTEAYNTWRTGVEDVLAKERYGISEEEADALDLSPEMALAHSKSQARVYMDAVTGAIGHITQQMPALLEAALLARDNEGKAKDAFFAAWPKLSMTDHGETIIRLGKNYRTLNPTADAATFIREVGAQSMVALRISADAAPAAPAEEESDPAPSAPFTPAGGGTPSGGPAPKENAFTELSKDFDVEEELLDLD